MMRQRSPELPAVEIYDGQQRVGAVVERANGQFEAAPVSGPSLGLFNSMPAAVHAILSARRA
jgi:hypothetical protein